MRGKGLAPESRGYITVESLFDAIASPIDTPRAMLVHDTWLGQESKCDEHRHTKDRVHCCCMT